LRLAPASGGRRSRSASGSSTGATNSACESRQAPPSSRLTGRTTRLAGGEKLNFQIVLAARPTANNS